MPAVTTAPLPADRMPPRGMTEPRKRFCVKKQRPASQLVRQHREARTTGTGATRRGALNRCATATWLCMRCMYTPCHAGGGIWLAFTEVMEAKSENCVKRSQWHARALRVLLLRASLMRCKVHLSHAGEKHNSKNLLYRRAMQPTITYMLYNGAALHYCAPRGDQLKTPARRCKTGLNVLSC